MGSRNGLNPKIRAPKGVGFGRALPAPFSFGKGVTLDGSNDYFDIPRLVGGALPRVGSFEFWCKLNFAGEYLTPLFISFTSTDPATSTDNYSFSFFINGTSILAIKPNYGETTIASSQNPGLFHIVMTYDVPGNQVAFHINGGSSAGGVTYSVPLVSGMGMLDPAGMFISTVKIGVNPAFGYTTSPFDELRAYSVVLSDLEVVTNYNKGIGANPSITEHLYLWYQFEKFESLDFSALQDNSDIRVGMKDMSGKFNHAAVHGMDTDINSPTYVLKPF